MSDADFFTTAPHKYCATSVGHIRLVELCKRSKSPEAVAIDEDARFIWESGTIDGEVCFEVKTGSYLKELPG